METIVAAILVLFFATGLGAAYRMARRASAAGARMAQAFESSAAGATYQRMRRDARAMRTVAPAPVCTDLATIHAGIAWLASETLWGRDGRGFDCFEQARGMRLAAVAKRHGAGAWSQADRTLAARLVERHARQLRGVL
jgi:hypothetical protein